MAITVNNFPIEHFKFPGGECQVRLGKIEIGDHVLIHAWLYNSDDIMCMMLTVNAIRKVNPHAVIDLTIPYLPYARQDRVCSPGEAFSAEVMATLINSMKCDRVTVYDPHSIISVGLIERSYFLDQHTILQSVQLEKFIREKDLTIVSPDAGAELKIEKLSEVLSTTTWIPALVFCEKTRDPKTGFITCTNINRDVRDENLIIIDDICDGGRTFIELAKVLKEEGAGDLYLYVTHGIFSNGFAELQKYFKEVFCFHIFPRSEPFPSNFLTVFSGIHYAH